PKVTLFLIHPTGISQNVAIASDIILSSHVLLASSKLWQFFNLPSTLSPSLPIRYPLWQYSFGFAAFFTKKASSRLGFVIAFHTSSSASNGFCVVFPCLEVYWCWHGFSGIFNVPNIQYQMSISMLQALCHSPCEDA
ncbi:hypothetical protein PIB30_000071, partial [Stylosanthes scabra]|nr:hypothetical protein [Stylosanthes scabra]